MLPGQPAPAQQPSGLLIAAGIVAFGFMGSRLLGVVRTAAIADQFGSSGDIAAYRVAGQWLHIRPGNAGFGNGA